MTRLIHVTTTDISLELLLGPQLEAFAAAGYEVIGMSAPGPFVRDVERRGIRHVPLEEARTKMGPSADALALDQRLRGPRARALGWSPSLRSVSGNVARLLEEYRNARR